MEAWLKAWLAWLTGGSLDARPTTSLLRSELESSTKENFADGAERSTGEARPCVEGEDEEGGGTLLLILQGLFTPHHYFCRPQLASNNLMMMEDV